MVPNLRHRNAVHKFLFHSSRSILILSLYPYPGISCCFVRLGLPTQTLTDLSSLPHVPHYSPVSFFLCRSCRHCSVMSVHYEPPHYTIVSPFSCQPYFRYPAQHHVLKHSQSTCLYKLMNKFIAMYILVLRNVKQNCIRGTECDPDLTSCVDWPTMAYFLVQFVTYFRSLGGYSSLTELGVFGEVCKSPPPQIQRSVMNC
jgi:hypothetical protein